MTASWQVCADTTALALAGADAIAAAARSAIAAHGRFRVVLAGGTTPLACYRQLAASRQDWPKWELYYGDERCLPADDAERNSCMVATSGLGALAGHNFTIPAELGAESASSAYADIIANALPFDLVVLGVGEDGHTASLFPGQPWMRSDASVLAVHDAPKPPSDRVSLGLVSLRNTRSQLVLAGGVGKHDAIAAWRAGADLPIARVTTDIACRILIAGH